MSRDRTMPEGPLGRPVDRPGPHRIFRPEAVEHYVSRAIETVLPRFLAPRTLSWLWLVVGLLLAALLVVAVLLESRTGTSATSWIGHG